MTKRTMSAKSQKSKIISTKTLKNLTSITSVPTQRLVPQREHLFKIYLNHETEGVLTKHNITTPTYDLRRPLSSNEYNINKHQLVTHNATTIHTNFL